MDSKKLVRCSETAGFEGPLLLGGHYSEFEFVDCMRSSMDALIDLKPCPTEQAEANV